MAVSRTSLRPTAVLAGSATFGALASLITLAAPPALQPPFPILFYLKFDVSEVVDLSSFMIFGPTAGLLTALIHATILGTVAGGAGSGPFFGPSLKFLGVLSTYIGLFVASRIGRQSLLRTTLTMTSLALITRVALMTVANYFYIVFLAQTVFGVDYTGFAQFVLSQSGVNLTGSGLVIYILGLTAIYNAVHAVFSVVVSLLLVNALMRRAPNLLESRAWITRVLNPASGKPTLSSPSGQASS
jgi:riboflavin transporter FmnP